MTGLQENEVSSNSFLALAPIVKEVIISHARRHLSLPICFLLGTRRLPPQTTNLKIVLFVVVRASTFPMTLSYLTPRSLRLSTSSLELISAVLRSLKRPKARSHEYVSEFIRLMKLMKNTCYT